MASQDACAARNRGRKKNGAWARVVLVEVGRRGWALPSMLKGPPE